MIIYCYLQKNVSEQKLGKREIPQVIVFAQKHVSLWLRLIDSDSILPTLNLDFVQQKVHIFIASFNTIFLSQFSIQICKKKHTFLYPAWYFVQSCEMSQIWQIYLCKNIKKLG